VFDYRYLDAFLATARSLSITKAAKQLGIAHSAVSRQIGLLEEAIGADLFFRGARGVDLTPKGKELFAKTSETDQWIKNEFSDAHPPIRIGGLEGAISMWLGRNLMSAEAEELPSNLVLKILSNEQIKAALENKEIDMGLSSQKIESEWVSSRKLFPEKIVLVSAHKIDLKKIESYCWIGVRQSAYLQKAFPKKKPKTSIQAGSIDLVLRLVAAEKGIAALPESVVSNRKLATTPLPITGEAIYLNLLNYQKQPGELTEFISRFLKI
jgi:DNA-binding transcriptional LysR family regulator